MPSFATAVVLLLSTPVGPRGGILDTQPPTIVAHRTPLANAGGWNNTPVTVWFTCTDNFPGVNCPAQVILEESGRNQLVTRTATDAAGNHATASVTISIDREGPVVKLTSGFSAETASPAIEVTASVDDGLSGLFSAGCNGAAAPIVARTLECGVALKPGMNTVLVHAVDAAGNTSSASSRTVRVTGARAALHATPAAATLSVGEDWPLSVVDQFGRPRPGATWTTSDEAIAHIKAGGGGGAAVRAVGPGIATITATVSGVTAAMHIAVLSIGTRSNFPKGTVRWSAPPRAAIVDSETIFAGYGADALYSIEYATSDRRRATIRAYAMSGAENWMGALPVHDNETVLDVMPHASGGLLFVVRDAAAQSSAVIHYAGRQGESWRYQSSGYTMQAVTTGDGSVVMVEHSRLAARMERSQIVVLDGGGRAVAKQVLPQFISKTERAGAIVSQEPATDPIGFLVDASGHARFMIVHGERFESRAESRVESALDLYAVAPDGSMEAIRLDSLPRRELTALSDDYLRPISLVPDSEGVLALYTKQDKGPREESHGKYLGAVRRAFTLPGSWRPTVSTVDGFGIGRDASSSGPLVARNLRTGAMLWQRSIPGVAALGLSRGGAAVRDENGGLRTIEEDGSMDDVDDLGVGPGIYVGARFHVRDARNTLRAVTWKPLNDGTLYTDEEAEGRRKPTPRR